MTVQPKIRLCASLICAAAGALSLSPAALAEALTVQLGGGWQATIFDPDHVGLSVMNGPSLQADGRLVLSNSINVVNDGVPGPQAPFVIAFQQIAPAAQTVSRIVLDSLLVNNNTHMDIVGWQERVVISGAVTINSALSWGFESDPFNMALSSTSATFSNGKVSPGSDWFPGLFGGDLVLDINTSAASGPVTFYLRGIPTLQNPIPTPGAALVGLMGGALLALRRRR